MWKDLSPQWRTAFEEAWAAYQSGSVPIGAAVYAPDGTLLVRERNRSGEPDAPYPAIIHAEANAIRRLTSRGGYDIRAVALYTTMEPCPMCMGTAVMGHIRHLRYAARDPYCGAVHWKDEDPYIHGKQLDYTHVGGETELVQLTLQLCYEIKRVAAGGGAGVLAKLGALRPEALRRAERLSERQALERLARDGAPCGEVYDYILAESDT